MGLYGLLNYEKYLLNSLKNSSFSKKLLARIIMFLVMFILKTHISVIIYVFFNSTFFYDNILPIFTNMILSLLEDSIYDAIAVYKKYFYKLSKHILLNYGRKNMFWKRILITVLSAYMLIILSLVKIDNKILMLITIQNFISFFLLDFLLNFSKIKEYTEELIIKPKVTKKTETKKLNELFLEDYIKKETIETNDWIIE